MTGEEQGPTERVLMGFFVHPIELGFFSNLFIAFPSLLRVATVKMR